MKWSFKTQKISQCFLSTASLVVLTYLMYKYSNIEIKNSYWIFIFPILFFIKIFLIKNNYFKNREIKYLITSISLPLISIFWSYLSKFLDIYIFKNPTNSLSTEFDSFFTFCIFPLASSVFLSTWIYFIVGKVRLGGTEPG